MKSLSLLRLNIFSHVHLRKMKCKYKLRISCRKTLIYLILILNINRIFVIKVCKCVYENIENKTEIMIYCQILKLLKPQKSHLFIDVR